MIILYSSRFQRELLNILDYIAKDKPQSAKQFAVELKTAMNNLTHYPFRCRQSIYHKSLAIRDLIFKKYTIVYKIDEEKQHIIVLQIFNYNKP